MKLRWRNIATKITEERTSTSLQKPVYRMKMMVMVRTVRSEEESKLTMRERELRN